MNLCEGRAGDVTHYDDASAKTASLYSTAPFDVATVGTDAESQILNVKSRISKVDQATIQAGGEKPRSQLGEGQGCAGVRVG